MSSQSQDLLDSVAPYLEHIAIRAKKLPLFTIGITAAMTLFFVLSFVTSIDDAFSLRPSDIPAFQLSRLTTYPLVHASTTQFLLSIAAFIPLCARFERRYGTLRSLAMFLGPFESVPGLLNCLIFGIFRQDRAITGCAGFVLTMISIEAVEYAKVADHVVFAGREVPVYAAPIACLILSLIFLPASYFVFHAISIVVGFIFGSGKVDFLLVPLKVVSFVESKAGFLLIKVPMYITAADAASTAYSGLPTTQPPQSSATGSTISAPAIPGSSSLLSIPGTSADDPRSSNRTYSNSSATRPSVLRQASSKWTPGQRED